MASWWQRYRGFVRLQLMAWGAGLLGALIHLGYAEVTDPDRRLAPSVDAIPWGFVVFALSTVVVLLWWMRTRRPLRDRPGRVLLATLMVFAQVVAAVGAAAMVLSSDPDFVFGQTHVDSLSIPSRGGTAYLYRTGFLCGYTVYMRQDWSVMLRRVRSLDRRDCDTRTEDARLAWHDREQQIILLDENGERVESQPIDLSGFYWGPR